MEVGFTIKALVEVWEARRAPASVLTRVGVKITFGGPR